MHSNRRRPLLAGAAAAIACAAIAWAALAGDADPSTRPCGRAGASLTAAVDATVAKRIYTGELSGRETRADSARVVGSSALAQALARSDRAAVYAAVHAIVYAPFWHIVRLRVTQSGRVLADVGGPYVIAPVSGAVRLDGAVVGHYVMSVQDDTGYVKLVSRFIGVPVEVYRSGALLMGTLRPGPPRWPLSAQTLTLRGRTYLAESFGASAFPSGSLGIALLLPLSSSMSSQSCASVASSAWGSIAEHVAARLKPLDAHFHDLVGLLRILTGGVIGVASPANASHHIAGAQLPARMPQNGATRYRGQDWNVFSWQPTATARVYLLTPRA